MSRPSSIKIQKTGAEEIGNAEVRSPASGLDVGQTTEPPIQSERVDQPTCQEFVERVLRLLAVHPGGLAAGHIQGFSQAYTG